MKVLFVCPYPHDKAPSQRFRFEQFLGYLKKEEITYQQVSFLSTSAWKILYAPGNVFRKMASVLWGFIKRFFLMFRVPFYDVVFIHREASPIGPPVFEWVIAKVWKKKIIYDFDDAIWIPNTSSQNALVRGIKSHDKVGKICAWAWKVSVGNAYLGSYAQGFNSQVVVLPTTIDLSYQQGKKKNHFGDEKVVVGWTGSHSTLPYLYCLKKILKKLVEDEVITLLVICNQKPSFDFDFEFKPWKASSEIDDLLLIDIGIMPLVEDAWSKGKCGFKALQYLSLGIPAVVSPVGVNAEIVKHGERGFLADDGNDWYLYIKNLAEDAKMRQAMGALGYDFVKNNYSTASQKEVFLGLFRD